MRCPCMALQPELVILQNIFVPTVGRRPQGHCRAHPSPPHKLPASPTLQQAAPLGAHKGLAFTVPQ